MSPDTAAGSGAGLHLDGEMRQAVYVAKTCLVMGGRL